ncbi:uncharacterized protein [Amphiura filiformis]|uniref:uncharacterized protein isoform X2 n=1 Tax=Amphiura filiformis TaxID=82378 RepID=UPI003B21D25B
MYNDKMTIKMCTDFCITQPTTMRFAGVQYAEECFCGVESADYARLGRKEDHECDYTCSGNSDEICGGTNRISIYDLTGSLSCKHPSLPNGVIAGDDFSFGNWVIFTCDSNFELIGDSALQCVLGDTSNESSWSGDIPFCRELGYDSCPDGWVASEDNCYFVSDGKLDYQQASYRCREKGANLTSILSMKEQHFHAALLTVLAKDDVWIGFDDLDMENNFSWTDGYEASFTYWAPDEPNDDNVGEDCTHLVISGSSSGKWNDEGCGSTLKYICKKPKVSKSPETTSPTVTFQPSQSTYEPRTPFSTTKEPIVAEKRHTSEGVIAGSVVGCLLILLLIKETTSTTSKGNNCSCKRTVRTNY